MTSKDSTSSTLGACIFVAATHLVQNTLKSEQNYSIFPGRADETPDDPWPPHFKSSSGTLHSANVNYSTRLQSSMRL